MSAFWNLLVISLNTNELLKIVLHIPRPYWISRGVKALSIATYFSIPSDRARNAVSCWGFAAKGPHRSRAWPAALFLVFIIGRSRVYLGVHFSWDVPQAGL
jgi:membrane-associated phospholipid phosphatase